MEKYSDMIMGNVRQNLNLDISDESRDSEIMEMSRDEVLERFLVWEGIIGFQYLIKEAVESIYKVELKDR